MMQKSNSERASAVYEAAVRKLAAGDPGAFYDAFDSESQEELDLSLLNVVHMILVPPQSEQLKAASGRDRFSVMVKQGIVSFFGQTGSQVVHETEFGDRAELTIRDAEGNEDTVTMLRESGQWKIRYEQPDEEDEEMDSSADSL